MSDLDRFWAKVDRNGPVVRPELGSCWIWTGALRSGYGTFSIKHKAVVAHKWIYEQTNGPVEGLLRHRCDNRACIRPDHLEPGTHKQNTQDMLERNPRFVSKNELVAEARKLAAEGKSVAYIAKTLGETRTFLVPAIQGQTYKHVDVPPVDEIYLPIFKKLTEEQYEEIVDALTRPYHGQGKDLAAKYGVDPAMITFIKKKKAKTIRGASQ